MKAKEKAIEAFNEIKTSSHPVYYDDGDGYIGQDFDRNFQDDDINIETLEKYINRPSIEDVINLLKNKDKLLASELLRQTKGFISLEDAYIIGAKSSLLLGLISEIKDMLKAGKR